MILRSHQSDLAENIRDKGQQHLPLSILAWVVPGGGKSWLPGIILQRFPSMKLAWFVPRVALREQACTGMLRDFGIAVRESDNNPDPSRNLHGFVASQQSLTSDPNLYVHEFRRHPYILVTDEIHHAKIKPDGSRNELGIALDRLEPLAKIHLKMTGTLDTNDNCRIWGCQYTQQSNGELVDPDSSADILIRYNRCTAIMEGAIVPIEFHHLDGPTNYIDASGEKEVILSAANRKEKAAALFTALRTEMAVTLMEMGLDHWKQHGDRLVIVCAFQTDAKEHAKRLKQRGIEVALAISDEGPDALEAIRRFRDGSCRVLLTCAMCYEGLDIPPITHIICLTHIRSIPWIEQMLARAWRAFPGKFKCWAFVPEDPDMLQVIDRIRRETPSLIGPPKTGSSGSGGSGDRVPVVAISSDVESIRSELLDLVVAPGMIREKVIEAFKGLGLSEDDPLVEQMVARLISPRSVTLPDSAIVTPTEEERRLRNGIYKMCNAYDFSKGNEPGTTMKVVHRQMGYVSFDRMTLEQFRRAAQIASSICS